MRMSGFHRLSVWSALLLCGLCGGCTRGRSSKPAEPKPDPAAQPAADDRPANQLARPPADQAAQPSAEEDWLAGRLPASVRAGTPVSGGELVVRLDADPPSLNTLIDNDALATRVVRHRVYQTLVGVDPYDDPQYRHRGELAENWEISEDARVYTLHLRRDVKWHDGQPFSARDVIATYDKILDPTTKAASQRSYYEELESYSAPDPYTVVLTWKRPYFLTLDTLVDTVILPAHLIEKLSGPKFNDAATNRLNRRPIGTGPFRFVSWEAHNKIVLARNDAFHGKKPHIDRLVFRIVSDPAVALQLAERNELDLNYKVTSEQWMHMDSPALRQNWNRSRFFANQYAWIGWNNRRPFFSDPNVRRAMTLLVDRPGLIDKLMYGLPRPTSCSFYWASADCDAQEKPLPYDPAQAGRLLDAAGWIDRDHDGMRDKDGRRFRFVLLVPSAALETQRLMAKLKEDLGRAGVEMDLQSVEWAAMLKRLRDHDFDACTLLWNAEARVDPSDVWHSKSIEDGSNFINFSDPEADRLIEQARVTLDPAARSELFRKFGAILTAAQPYTFLYVRAELNLLHKRVKGARPSLYWWQFEDMWLDPAGKGP
jgi:peptide/nickel transport system substrate-binding protein